MTYWCLIPEKLPEFKSLVGHERSLDGALAKYVGMWRYILDSRLEGVVMDNRRGSRRLRKKRLQALLKDCFIERFMDCLEPVELHSKPESPFVLLD